MPRIYISRACRGLLFQGVRICLQYSLSFCCSCLRFYDLLDLRFSKRLLGWPIVCEDVQRAWWSSKVERIICGCRALGHHTDHKLPMHRAHQEVLGVLNALLCCTAPSFLTYSVAYDLASNASFLTKQRQPLAKKMHNACLSTKTAMSRTAAE